MTKTDKSKGFSLRHRPATVGHPARWVVAFRPSDGSRRWPEQVAPPEIRTEAEARRWVKGLLDARAAAPPKPQRSPSQGPTVRELYAAWIQGVDRRPDLENATKAGYRSAFETQVLPTIGDEPLAACDVAFLAEWVRQLRRRPAKVPMRGKPAKDAATPRVISPSRVANVLSAFSTFLSDQIVWRKVTFAVNPALDPSVRREVPVRPRPTRVRLQGERPGVPTMEDAQAVVDCQGVPVAVRVRAAIVFTTGERDGEIAGLRVRCVRLTGPVPAYEVVEAVQIHGPDGHATPGHLKTLSSERAIPMHPAAKDAIEEWLTVHWPKLFGRPPGPDDFLFPSPKHKRGHRPKSANLLRAALKAAGRPTSRGGKPVTFHRARHTFAGELVRLGVPREVRKLLLGHAADGVDEAHYAEHGLAALAEYVAKIPLRWPSARPDVRPAAEHDAEISNDIQSHLRDLNSRPTVYEFAACSAGLGKGAHKLCVSSAR